MEEATKPTVNNAEVYKALDQQDIGTEAKIKSAGSRKTWLASFTKEHLPSNRLRANEDDLSEKFESVDCTRKRKKKRGKSKANLSTLRITGTLSRLQRRLCRNILQFPSDIKYDTYLPLKEMWTKYMEELIQFSSLKSSSLSAVAQKVMKADFHGCPLTVQKSKCPSYVGVHGIVLQETRNMFVLITPDNVVKKIPKPKSIFTVTLHNHVFTIHGNQFIVKPGERAAKKFKIKPSIDL